jgi:SHOCT-like domain
MSEDRNRILSLLAAGKITADEAERLLDALDTAAGAAAGPAFTGDPSPLVAALPKFLYVQVAGSTGDNVHVKIPLALVRSGLKLTSLIPAQAMDQINKSMSEHGISVDFANLRPEDIDELIESLREMEITVDGENGDVVRVYCA